MSDQLAQIKDSNEVPHDTDSKTIKGMAQDAGVSTAQPETHPDLPEGVKNDGAAVDNDSR